jgi:hypothetical protein
VHVAESVDEDGSGMLVVRAGQAWGSNRMRFVRSSANHVFVCEAAGGGSQVLRFRPDR